MREIRGYEGAVVHHLGERRERDVWIDRGRSVPDQERELGDLPRLPRLHHDPALHPLALADQVVMHCARCEQARNRNALGSGAAVGEYQDVCAALDGLHRLLLQAIERRAQARVQVVVSVEDDRERDRDVVWMVDLADSFELGFHQDRLVQL